ncbi:MAG: response regulator transcription factor [Thiohalocapsa sp.]|jgi:DNA-binding response OmpR family regulator|uniref:response regulator transcription factor n=1 Tax=Thiohalocapsa sp. TaxID=2497641 RepID=UPI0025EBC5C5|nr:response regulator transcription factor [Thiohalocapsa sp.]MCG6939975.1 response regulator transcription factor [Thiohalocapsa sp.]
MSALDNSQQVSPDGDTVRIGLLEDDPVIAGLLTLTFEQAGWAYRHFARVGDMTAALETQRFDLLMLDWCLPDGQADSVIRFVRNCLGWDLPIVVESVNDDEQLIVKALEMGADDYVVKPLRMSEARARIGALLRRARRDRARLPALGAYRIDEVNRQIYREGERLSLTALEYALTQHFFHHPNELLSREHLLTEVWERNPRVDTRTVDAHVSRLRRKLGLGAATGLQISTLRGYGYRLEQVG